MKKRKKKREKKKKETTQKIFFFVHLSNMVTINVLPPPQKKSFYVVQNLVFNSVNYDEKKFIPLSLHAPLPPPPQKKINSPLILIEIYKIMWISSVNKK